MTNLELTTRAPEYEPPYAIHGVLGAVTSSLTPGNLISFAKAVKSASACGTLKNRRLSLVRFFTGKLSP
jgi:hypothetical protein